MKTIKEENIVKEEIDRMFTSYLAKEGIRMSKLISSGSSGFFSYTSPTYDERTVYTKEDLLKLIEEGFNVTENAGNFIFNMFWVNF